MGPVSEADAAVRRVVHDRAHGLVGVRLGHREELHEPEGRRRADAGGDPREDELLREPAVLHRDAGQRHELAPPEPHQRSPGRCRTGSGRRRRRAGSGPAWRCWASSPARASGSAPGWPRARARAARAGTPMAAATTSAVRSSSVGPRPPLMTTRSEREVVSRSAAARSSRSSPTSVLRRAITPRSQSRSMSHTELVSRIWPVRSSSPVASSSTCSGEPGRVRSRGQLHAPPVDVAGAAEEEGEPELEEGQREARRRPRRRRRPSPRRARSSPGRGPRPARAS